jgi:hypothetical protein
VVDGAVDGAALVLDAAVSPAVDGGVALVVAAAPGVASGLERTSEAAGALAAVLASAPVEATSWPDHQSFDARCLGDAFR